jgi:hypothetical protein
VQRIQGHVRFGELVTGGLRPVAKLSADSSASGCACSNVSGTLLEQLPQDLTLEEVRIHGCVRLASGSPQSSESAHT